MQLKILQIYFQLSQRNVHYYICDNFKREFAEIETFLFQCLAEVTTKINEYPGDERDS